MVCEFILQFAFNDSLQISDVLLSDFSFFVIGNIFSSFLLYHFDRSLTPISEWMAIATQFCYTFNTQNAEGFDLWSLFFSKLIDHV